jgi:pre-mRNA-processing factor 6
MAKALQECPTSGLLWSENIWHLEPRTQRKPRSLEAIKKVDNDPILFVTVARIFWGERKLDKAMNWFEKAILLDADLGDTWAWYYKFLLQHGTEVSLDSAHILNIHRLYLFANHPARYLSVAMDADTSPQEKRDDVVGKCVMNEPKHGEVWAAVAKDPANAGKGVE